MEGSDWSAVSDGKFLITVVYKVAYFRSTDTLLNTKPQRYISSI